MIRTRHAEKVWSCAAAHPQAFARNKLPLEVSVQGSDVYASGDVDALCDVIDVLQRSLDTIKDGAHDSWTQLHREGFTGPQHRIADRHTGWMQSSGKMFGLLQYTLTTFSSGTSA